VADIRAGSGRENLGGGDPLRRQPGAGCGDHSAASGRAILSVAAGGT
jgi:hypothetical protein